VTCEHGLWHTVPRAYNKPSWYVCSSCNMVVSEFEFEALWEDQTTQEKDELLGQVVIDWGVHDA